MRKKWVIIAFVLFLGIAWGLLTFLNRNSYPFDEVVTEICKETNYVDQMIAIDRKTHLASKAANPSVLEKVMIWYESNFPKKSYHAGMKTIDPNKPILLIYETDSVTVELSYKMGLVNAVEIRSFLGDTQSALKLKSRLSERFPNLLCKITGDEKTGISK